MANLNTSLSPAPAVTCLTTGRVVASGFTGNVTVALSVNPTGATLGGTLTVAATAGVATFSDLTLNRSGKNFKLSATGTNLRTATSAAFSIPTQCVFTTQPSTTVEDVTMSNVVVTVRDGAGNTDTAYNGTVTLAIYTASAAGTLSGTLSVSAVSGVATFTTLSIDTPGTYTLIATASEVSTAYPPASVVSSSFSIVQLYGMVAVAITANTNGFQLSGSHGSLTPGTYLWNGSNRTIQEVSQSEDTPTPGPTCTVTVSMASVTSQDAFTTLTITDSLGTAYSFNTASADTWNGAGTWEWYSVDRPIPSAGNYSVVFS